MIFRSIYILLILQLFTACSAPPEKVPFFSDNEEALIRDFFAEQGLHNIGDINTAASKRELAAVYSFIDFKYNDYPNDNIIKSYNLTVRDTSVHTAVLTDVLNNLTAIDSRFMGVAYTGRNGLHIDSIKIVTNGVIVLNTLGLSLCNLTHLPTDMKKIRVKHLDLTDNVKTFVIPETITELGAKPAYWDSLIINYDKNYVNALGEHSEILKDWLWDHCSINDSASFRVEKQ